jgi:hypothetical protein
MRAPLFRRCVALKPYIVSPELARISRGSGSLSQILGFGSHDAIRSKKKAFGPPGISRSGKVWVGQQNLIPVAL